MDAGLAAVCGALAGAAATTGAAFVAGWWQRENARLVARAEHARKLHDSRQAAYKEFAEKLNEILDAHGPGAPAGEGIFSRERARAVTEMYAALRNHAIAVALVGPDEIAVLAEKAEGSCFNYMLRIHGLRASVAGFEKAESAIEDMISCKGEFLRATRKVLTEDGHLRS